jgi:pimeloyl-ACP methyl ester carboxylesterase
MVERSRFSSRRQEILTRAGLEMGIWEGPSPVHYSYRSGQGPAIVGLHGLGDSSLTYPEFLTTEPIRDHAVVLPDIPGFGMSPLPPDPPQESSALRGQALSVLELLDALSVDRFVALGHSMGGAVAIHLATLAPNRCMGILNLEGNLTFSDCTLSAEAVEADTKGAYAAWRAGVVPRLVEEGNTGDASITRYVMSFVMASPRSYLEAAYSLVEESTDSRLGERYAALETPRLYIHGGKSSPAETRAFIRGRGLPESFHPDSGHWPHWNARDAVAADCADFLAGLPG